MPELDIHQDSGVRTTLYWAAVFFIVAIVAAVFGFGGIAADAAGIARVLFFIFIVLFVISTVFGYRGRGRSSSRL